MFRLNSRYHLSGNCCFTAGSPRVSQPRIRLTSAAVMIVVSIALQPTTRAQAVYGTTSRPTVAPNQQRLSPYLNLFRADNSVLGPYHSFVQPRQELQRNLSRQQLQIRQLEQASVAVGASSQGAPSSRQPTGRGGTFNNYLHYYRINQPQHSR